MRRIIIGDIHGCYDELRDLLEAVGPGKGDRLIAVGDVVDRGPASEKVLEFFRDRADAVSVTGNHERKHVRSAQGLVEPAVSQLIVRRQLGERYGRWVDFMADFPRDLELAEAIVVHGMLEPGVPLAQQRDNVVIGTMSGEKHMVETYPGPWYEHYTGPKPVVCGHHSYLRTGEPLIREGLVYAIDTGCVYGEPGRLTALILPEFRIVSVPSRGNHWAEQRARYTELTQEKKGVRAATE